MIDRLAPFVTEPPVWVWVILAGLIVIGLAATRARAVPARVFLFLPLVGVLSLVTVAQSGAVDWFGPIVWAAFAAAYGLGAGAGWRAQGRIILGLAEGPGRRVRLRGEWLTFGLLMVIFWLRFVRATLEAVAPAIEQGAAGTFVFVAIAAMAAGAFLGRSLRTLRVAYGDQSRAS